ncbi:MAG: single-stranded-DNA-specific exonuclease RecJ, partial [Planctomycetes bacterium]|nr:single-stranded-DNA-specific exonuclease RecJ [Planctomycetota bacterium]
LVSAGMEDAECIKEFLEPSFESWTSLKSFPSLIKGSQVLFEAIKSKKKICIHGDFDTDGVCATVILREFFKAIHAPCLCLIPTREEGHGISEATVKRAHALGAELIVSVDCGITAVEEAKMMKSLGMELVITDHHIPDEELPEALAITNPFIDGDDSFKVLSGAGVSLKLALECARLFPPTRVQTEGFQGFIHMGTALAAIATIGDVVPLVGYNRSLLSKALPLLNDVKNPGLQALLKICHLNHGIKSEDLAFQLIPRLNAAQRMEQGELVWELLASEDDAEAMALARKLNDLNEKRKELQQRLSRRILDELSARYGQEDPPSAIVVEGYDWLEGLSGLIASKVCETYGRPALVVLIKEGLGQGSCRAPLGYHLKEALDECAELLVSYGGHAQAAGFRIHESKLADFKEKIAAVMTDQIQNKQLTDSLNPKLQIVAEIPWPQVNRSLYEELGKLEPFGEANRKPLFATRGLLIDGNPRYIGKDKNHIIVSLFKPGQESVDAIGFGMAKVLKSLDLHSKIDICYTIGLSRYNNKVQLQIEGMRMSRVEMAGRV